MRGLRHEATQCRLLTELVLTYQNTLDIAKGMQAADSNTRLLKTRELPINKVIHRASPGKERKTGHHCGKTGYFPNQCCFKDAYCHACGKKGCIAPVCKSAPRGNSSSTQVRKQPSWQKLKTESSSSSSSSEEHIVRNVGRYSNDPFHVQMLTNGKRLSIEVDTGQKSPSFRRNLWKRYFQKINYDNRM